tara:strand:+ start:252 stop:494 length:243 start_codon:yes stop_codon:yes gene_type:complete
MNFYSTQHEKYKSHTIEITKVDMTPTTFAWEMIIRAPSGEEIELGLGAVIFGTSEGALTEGKILINKRRVNEKTNCTIEV